MGKVKNFFKSIKYKYLIKLIVLNIVVIYALLSGIYTVYTVVSFNSINKVIEADSESFEQGLKDIEDEIVYLNITDLRENNREDKIAYYQMNYPNAMYVIEKQGALIGEQANILRHAILYGVLIGVVIYIYKNTTKISKLLIGYLIVYAIVWLVNENLYLLPSVHIKIENCMSVFSLGDGSSDDNLMILFYIVAVVMVVIKVIKNRFAINKLNKNFQRNSQKYVF